MSMIPDKAKERFLNENINVVFEEDEVSFFEATWLFSVLKFEYNGKSINKQSVRLIQIHKV